MSETKGERRLQILKAAERLFHHYGHQKTTVADIAREAGVGVGTVYLEFESKEHIVGVLSNACHAEMLEAMRKACSGRASSSYAARLRAAMRGRLAYYLQVGREGQHAAELLHCQAESVREACAAYRKREEELIIELLRAAHAAKEFYVPKPAETARALLRAYASFQPPWLRLSSAKEAEAQLEAMHEVVLMGLVRR